MKLGRPLVGRLSAARAGAGFAALGRGRVVVFEELAVGVRVEGRRRLAIAAPRLGATGLLGAGQRCLLGTSVLNGGLGDPPRRRIVRGAGKAARE